MADGRLRGIRLGSVSVQEGKMADEMMLIGSGVIMKPVLQWDDQVIGAGMLSFPQFLTNFFLLFWSFSVGNEYALNSCS